MTGNGYDYGNRIDAVDAFLRCGRSQRDRTTVHRWLGLSSLREIREGSAAASPEGVSRQARGGIGTGTRTQPVEISGCGIAAEIPRLAGWSRSAHEQRRLLHLVVGHGRQGAGRDSQCHHAPEGDRSHRLSRCSFDRRAVHPSGPHRTRYAGWGRLLADENRCREETRPISATSVRMNRRSSG